MSVGSVMNEILPRYEFRVFAAQSLGMVADKMRQLSPCEQIEESVEAYIITANMHDHNVKLRDAALDIKRLVSRQNGLEQWKPVIKQRFPLTSDFVAKTLIPILGTAYFDLSASREKYSERKLTHECFRTRFGICVASVFKRRFRFMVSQCAAEFDELLINGAAIQSVAVESEDASAVASARSTLGLANHENVNYPLAIQRVLGLQPLPDDAWYGFPSDK